MSPEDQEYFETYLQLFSTKGWQQFQEEIKKLNDTSRETAIDVPDSNMFWERKGSVTTLTYIENFAHIVEHNYEALQETESMPEE